jgi:hypothetical protein
MKYASLQEFFYKLQNVLYLLILFPLLVFIFFFVYETYRPEAVSEEQRSTIYVALLVFIVIDLSVASFIFYRNLKAIRKIASLGLRLEKYYAITVLRFSLVSFADLILIAGYFMTGNLIFAILFGISLVFFLLSWPRTSKVCADLKLKGDEREMVYYKKMNLH